MILIASLHQPMLETQRHRHDESRIQYLVQHPEEIKDILVYEDPVNGERFTVNGHHRVESARRLGWTHIDANIEPGTREAATRYWDPIRQSWSEIEGKVDPKP